MRSARGPRGSIPWLVVLAGLAATAVSGTLLAKGNGLLPAAPAGAAAPEFDLEHIESFALCLAGALASGAALAYHPLYLRRVASIAAVDYPKIIITYTVIGALIGVIATVDSRMAFAIFGIGGLMRFRTELQSAKETGRAIFATVTGIFWGMKFWQGAILATAVAWCLIYLLDWRVAYRMIVRGLDESAVAESARAHQRILEAHGCRVTQVKKNPRKNQFSIVFRASRRHDRDDFEAAFEEEIDERLRATVDWPEEA